MAKKGLIIGISIGAVAVIATAITVPLVLMNNGGGDVPSKEVTLTLNAGEDGYFIKEGEKQYVIKNIKPGTTLKDALASDKSYVDPAGTPITPKGEKTAIPCSFEGYLKDNKKIDDSFVINENVTLNASYELECLRFEVPSDSTNNVSAYITQENYTGATWDNVPPNVKYALDDPKGVWNDYPTEQASAITIEKGHKIYVKGNNPNGFSFTDVNTDRGHTTFKFETKTTSEDATVDANGNVMSLLDDGACNLDATFTSEGCFQRLFYECKFLRTPPELPARTLVTACYYYMFYLCAKLEIGPDLPADCLTDFCYNRMFMSCSSLKVAPIIAATTCADNILAPCDNMFNACYSLKVAPELNLSSEIINTKKPAQLFNGMFAHCRGLEKLRVHFGVKDSNEWPSANQVTQNWLFHASEEVEAETQPIFEWVGTTEGVPDDVSHVPQTREVEGEVVPFWKIVTISE